MWADDVGRWEIKTDRNDFGDVLLYLKQNTDGRRLSLCLPRKTAAEIAFSILQHLVVYPSDNKKRIDGGLACCCDHQEKIDF